MRVALTKNEGKMTLDKNCRLTSIVQQNINLTRGVDTLDNALVNIRYSIRPM